MAELPAPRSACRADLRGRKAARRRQDAGVIVTKDPAPMSEGALVQVAGFSVEVPAECSIFLGRWRGGKAGFGPVLHLAEGRLNPRCRRILG